MSQKSVWGAKLMFGGYAGLKFTADKINEYIPTSKIYVEPFAGLGRTVELRHDKIVLNDMSDYAVDYLRKQYCEYEDSFSYPIIVTKEDFVDCILKHDSEDTFNLIDPPWRFTCYDSHKNAYCDRKPIEYYSKVLELVKELKGDWIICSAKDEHEIKKILTKTDYYKKIVTSDKKVIFGKHAQTLLISNRPFQITSTMDCESK
jgi:site-specific DNA-adenine methylase